MSLERSDILAAIRDSGNNISKAAEKLGVARRTLQDRMRFWGIPRGKAGRRKRKISYSRRSRNYAVGAVAIAAVAGAVVLSRKSGTTV